MSDEVKSAADRLRLVNSGESPLSIYGQFWSEEIAGDYAVVANAYLADHADDAENAKPLTAEILEASGWKLQKPSLSKWSHRSGLVMFSGIGCNHAEIEICGIDHTIETVGDLRKLLEALHVPAVVVVPKGGGE